MGWGHCRIQHFEVYIRFFKDYKLSTSTRLKNMATIFCLLNSQYYVSYNMIFCLFRTTSVEKPVPVLSFETHPYQIPYTHHHFEKNPSTFRTRTQFLETTRLRSVSVLDLKTNPFTLRSRTRTWVRGRKVYGFRTRTPDSGFNALKAIHRAIGIR